MADYAGHPFQAQLSKALASSGLQVHHVFAGKVGGPKGSLETADDQEVTFQSLGRFAQDKKSALSRVKVAVDFGRALRREVKRRRPDVVLAANVPPEGLLAAAFGHGEPRWIWWVQDLFALGAAGTLRRKSPLVGVVAEHFYRWAEGSLSLSASAIVLISESFRCHIPSAARGKVSVVHNWAPLEEMPLVDRSNPWARERGYMETFNFMYTGTLALKHSPALLVELAEEVSHDPRARVVVVSEGPGADYVRDSASELGLKNLDVLPFQPYERLPEVMGTADVLVALLENHAGVAAIPSKVLSYLCAGRPILAAIPAANLAAETVLRSQSGIVVRAGDSAAFRDAGRTLMANPELAAIRGRAGRAFAEQQFDIGRIRDRFMGILLPHLAPEC